MSLWLSKVHDLCIRDQFNGAVDKHVLNLRKPVDVGLLINKLNRELVGFCFFDA